MSRLALKLAVIAGSAILLASCTSSVDPDIEPAEPVSQAPQSFETAPVSPAQLPTGNLSASQINSALSERTFAFSTPDRSGQVTYFNDGTFSYQETGKGAGTGIWQAADGKLCEAYNPTSFLPRGTPSTCHPLSSDGASFTAGSMQLRPS